MEEPRSIEAVELASDGAERDGSRDSMFLLATLSHGKRKDVPMRVRNLSPGGLMADCKGRFRRDEPVTVALRGLDEIEGRIAWCEEGRIGVTFDETIDPREARKPVGAPR